MANKLRFLTSLASNNGKNMEEEDTKNLSLLLTNSERDDISTISTALNDKMDARNQEDEQLNAWKETFASSVDILISESSGLDKSKIDINDERDAKTIELDKPLKSLNTSSNEKNSEKGMDSIPSTGDVNSLQDIDISEYQLRHIDKNIGLNDKDDHKSEDGQEMLIDFQSTSEDELTILHSNVDPEKVSEKRVGLFRRSISTLKETDDVIKDKVKKTKSDSDVSYFSITKQSETRNLFGKKNSVFKSNDKSFRISSDQAHDKRLGPVKRLQLLTRKLSSFENDKTDRVVEDIGVTTDIDEKSNGYENTTETNASNKIFGLFSKRRVVKDQKDEEGKVKTDKKEEQENVQNAVGFLSEESHLEQTNSTEQPIMDEDEAYFVFDSKGEEEIAKENEDFTYFVSNEDAQDTNQSQEKQEDHPPGVFQNDHRIQRNFSLTRMGHNVSKFVSSVLNQKRAVSSELSPEQLKRYSRQLLISNGFGVEGQKKLLASKVLVVGAGGIGSTVLPYLAAAGVGSITVIDHDDVETSNLHRQIMHSELNISMNKAIAVCQAIKILNPSVNCVPIDDYFNATNALFLTSSHDVVVDATDNPKTRYLINDACVLSGSTPLVSGSAMGTEGQMTVYNYGEHACCYRCLYPKMNLAEGNRSCSDNGVLGPVPGLIGILQAMEVIKILTGAGTVMHDRLIMYDSFNCSFLNIKKPPGKKSSCPVCGPEAYIKSMDDSLRASQTARGPDGLCSMKEKTQKTGQFPELPSNLNISCQEYNVLRQDRHRPHILLDVRVKHQYQICSMDDSINIPLEELESRMDEVKALSDDWNKKICCICRRGIASAEATRMINEQMVADKGEDSGLILNIVGGLNAWADEVDPNTPMY